MTERSARHDRFSLERTFKAAPAKVFAAFATPEGKAAWFGGDPGAWEPQVRTFDFRPGGTERAAGRWVESGVVSDFRCTYYDIVPDERIVYAYEMQLNDVRISVSLATIELVPAGSGTRLTITEAGVFLDAFEDNGGRKHGTEFLLGRLAASLGEG